MNLKIETDIEDGVFYSRITIDSLGTETLSEDEERELLRNFPAKVCYRSLTFSKNVKIDGSVPVVTDDEVGESVVNVTLPAMTNREILLDKGFIAEYRVRASNIASTAVDDTVLTSKELVAQAYCYVFIAVVKEEIENLLSDMREKAPNFEGEEIVNV